MFPKRWYKTSILHCVISQNGPYPIYTAAEAPDHTFCCRTGEISETLMDLLCGWDEEM